MERGAPIPSEAASEPAAGLTEGFQPSTRRPGWNLPTRIAFRFACVYLVLYCLPSGGSVSLLSALTFDTERLTALFDRPWHALCPWVAVHVFHLSGPVTQYHPTGSGDTALNYVQVFCFAVIAAIAALLWSIFDRRRRDYSSLYPWLRLLVRFTLGFTLLAYGFAKVFPMQFTPPRLYRLTETFGEASPMGLLWTFMGASTAYTILCGVAEVTAGLLLLFRRTSTLGALLTAGVMLNIVLLNFCYDVPVKLYSSHLFAMALFLLIPDFKALWQFLILRRSSELQGVWVPPWERRPLRIARIAIQTLVIGAVLYSNISGMSKAMEQQSVESSKRSPLEGIWEVDTSSGLSTPAWQRIVIEGPVSAARRKADGSTSFAGTTYDEKKRSVKLQGSESGELTYRQPDGQHLELEGTLDKAPVSMTLHRSPSKGFLLTSRGFHWVSEYPFNR